MHCSHLDVAKLCCLLEIAPYTGPARMSLPASRGDDLDAIPERVVNNSPLSAYAARQRARCHGLGRTAPCRRAGTGKALNAVRGANRAGGGAVRRHPVQVDPLAVEWVLAWDSGGLS